MKNLKNKISLFIICFSFLTLLVSLMPCRYKSRLITAQDCAHNHLEHHESMSGSIYNIGHVEYWCCCNCHQSFYDENCTQLIEDTNDGLTNPNDGRYIPPVGFNLDEKTVKNGTLVDVKPEGTAFDKVYKVHVAGQFVLENIDISSYQEVALQIKSGVWHIYHDSSWTFVGDPNVWITYKLVQTSFDTWSIYQRKPGQDFTCKFSGANGSKLQDVLVFNGESSDYYVTNLRCVELANEEDITSQYGQLITDSAICSNNAIYSKVVEQAPFGFKNVYKTSANGVRDDAYYYANINVDNFEKLAFKIRFDGTLLLDGYDKVDTTHEWILVEVSSHGKYTYKIDFTNSAMTLIYTNTFTYIDEHPNVTIGALNHVLWKACLYPEIKTDSLYVTELRGYKHPSVGDVIDQNALSSNGAASIKEDKNSFIPVGFDSVYSMTCTIGDKTFDKYFSNKNLKGYSEISLAINAHGWFLFDGWSYYLDADEWVKITIINKGNDLFDVQFETRFKNIQNANGKVLKKENIDSSATIDDVDGFTPYSLNTLFYNSGVAFQEGKTISVTEIRGKQNIKLVENSVSEYSIVIENNNRYVAHAKDLLIDNLKKSSGATLSYSESNNEIFNKNSKKISIGSTSLLKSSGLLNNIVLSGGYIIATAQNSIFVYAEQWGDYITAINDLMNILFGYKFFAINDITMNHSSTITLNSIKKIVRTSFSFRDRITDMSSLDPDGAASLGFKHNYEWETSTQTHTICDHYLNIAKYKSAHPNWYSEGEDKWGALQYQLCYSAHGSTSEYQLMVDAVCTEIIADINNDTNTWVFDNSNNPSFKIDLSMQDNWYECNCDACKADKTTYGSYAGQQLHFVNDIANKMDAWLATNKPTLKCTYKLLAYQQSMKAPNQIDYSLNKNIELQFSTGCANIDLSKPFGPTGPECNVKVYNQLAEWVKLFNNCPNVSADNISIWYYSYCINNILPVFDHDAFAISYQNFIKLGVKKISHEMFTNQTPAVCFQDLSYYLKAKAMENVNIDLDVEAKDFIDAYYGSGGAKIYEYYQAVLSNMRNTYTDGVLEDMWGNHNNKKYWSKDVVNNLITLCDEAISDINSNETDEDRKALLIDRINRERCMPVYMLIEYGYVTKWTLSKYNSYLEFFETNCKKFGLNKVDSSTTLDDWINKH